MKIITTRAPDTFNPLTLTVTCESQDEVDALICLHGSMSVRGSEYDSTGPVMGITVRRLDRIDSGALRAINMRFYAATKAYASTWKTHTHLWSDAP